jgi:hypothetical protein
VLIETVMEMKFNIAYKTLGRYDRKNILIQEQSQSEKWDISVERIQEKINGKQYSGMVEYQVRCINYLVHGAF